MIYTIFAHYDTEGIIDDYVIYYLKQLRMLSKEIIFISDGEISETELGKLKHISSVNITTNHGEYDFGSYKRGFLYIKDKLTDDDTLIFCNDSCFGPVSSLKTIIKNMENKYDLWGIIKAKFIQTFFFVVGPKFFLDKDFTEFLISVKKEKNKNTLVEKYEKGLTALAQRKNLSIGAYYEEGKAKKLSIDNLKNYLQQRNIPTFINTFIPQYSNFDVYNENNFYLRSINFPFIKKSIFKDSCSIFKYFCNACMTSDYDYQLIENYLARKKITIKNFSWITLIFIFLKRNLKKLLSFKFFICCKKTNNGNFIFKLFKIPVYYKKNIKRFSPKIAVHLHFYYEDLYSEMEECLQLLNNYDCDVFVTGHNINSAILQKFQNISSSVQYIDCPNQGYDVGPFIQVLNSLNLDEYNFLIKIHTKRNVRQGEKINHYDVSGPKWRTYCLSFVSSKKSLDNSIRYLTDHPKIGMVADGHLINRREEPNDKPLTIKACEIIKSLGLKPSSLYFVAGTMFIAKTEVFKRLQHRFAIENFTPLTERRLDSLAHVFERVLGFLVSAEDYYISDYKGRNISFKFIAFCRAAEEVISKFFYQKKITKNRTLLIKIFKIPVFVKKNKDKIA